ncbi:protein kinase-like domain, concanavalin A-like lectin/glucanase domain protein [Tanacetum coccineum]
MKNGDKKPSKLLSPKYLSPASIRELNKNPSSPKRVHFINSIVILSADNGTEEKDVSSTKACGLNTGDITEGGDKVKEQSTEETEIQSSSEIDEESNDEGDESETEEEVEEIPEEEKDDENNGDFNSFPKMEELTHHEWLMKNPRPPWIRAKIRSGSPNNIKISCMFGHLFIRHTHLDLESPVNIMSRRQYNQIMTYRLKPRPKPSNPSKSCNFVSRVRGMKVFIGSFAYECDFMILEDTTSIIDDHLGEMVFGKPFINETGLVYDSKKGIIVFNQYKEKITFKMPHTLKIFEQTKLMGTSTDSTPPLAYENNFGYGRTHYYQSLLLGDEYKGGGRGIRHLVKLENEVMYSKRDEDEFEDEGEVT